MRVVICWLGISGYLSACWRALGKTQGVELKIISSTQGGVNAPFDPQITAGLDFHLLEGQQCRDPDYIKDLVVKHKPDAVILAGWTKPAYVRLAHLPELANAKFFMAMDTPWRDTWRQRLAWLKIRRLLRRLDGIVVPGERAWQFASHLRVGEDKIFRGMNGFDGEPLRNLYAQRVQSGPWPKQFLYVGQYQQRKGMDVLVAAYQAYRSRYRDAWPLVCCGAGPAAGLLQAPGVENRGFVQPAQQPPVWAAAGVFVIASRFEPWGLVIAEAGASGLPLLCTEACGATVEMVRPYFNGLSVATGQVEPLTRGLCWMHEHYADLPEMGRRSMPLAAAYSSEFWAARWLHMLRRVLPA